MPEPKPNFDDLMLLMERALSDRGWYVVVVADEVQLRSFRVSTATAAPPGSKAGGRTVILPNGSRVSTVAIDDPIHVPKGTPFTVVFMGRWYDEQQRPRWSKQMDRWRRESSIALTSLLS